MNPRRTLALAVAWMLVTSAGAGRASALTITRNFIAPGEAFPEFGGIAGEAPPNLLGGGDLANVIDAAADWWELAIHDPHALRVDFGWSALGGLTLAVATQYVLPQPPVLGQVEFDNDGSSVFFMDPSPYENSEFTTFTEYFDDLGGGQVNTGRVYTGAVGAAAGAIDILTVAMHEIGHFVGISVNLPRRIRITSPLPYPGTRIPTSDGHINIESALMSPYVAYGTREIGSWVDILAGAQMSGWSDIDLDPVLIIAGDLSGDGLVGQTDLDIVLDNWGQSAPPADVRADASGDGFVGQTDLDYVLDNWGQTVTSPAFQAAPEPGALVILAAGACLLQLRRRR